MVSSGERGRPIRDAATNVDYQEYSFSDSETCYTTNPDDTSNESSERDSDDFVQFLEEKKSKY